MKEEEGDEADHEASSTLQLASGRRPFSSG